jgi:NADP-dependent 3-hydroxy acid dehydrogenase YdfG
MAVVMNGQVVLIVGASSGIGRATALLFSREGATVVAAARREDRLRDLKEELAKEHREITVRCADASIMADMAQLAQETLERLGKIDVLVFASGTNTPNRAMEHLQPNLWNSIIDVNLNGAFYATHAVLPSMRSARSGHLIYLSSMAGIAPDLSGAAYQASKRGVIGLAHALRMEEQQNGIRVSVICPGLVNTELVHKRPKQLAPEALAKALQSEDVAEMVLYISKMPRRAVASEVHLLPTFQ